MFRNIFKATKKIEKNDDAVMGGSELWGDDDDDDDDDAPERRASARRGRKKEEKKKGEDTETTTTTTTTTFKSLLFGDALNNNGGHPGFDISNSFREMKNNFTDYVQKTHESQVKLFEANAYKFSKELNSMGLKVHMPEVMKTRTEMELDRLRKTEREKMNIFCARTAKLVRCEIRLKEAEKERTKAMEADELTNEIVGKVNALKRKVEKERRLRAEADEAFANAYEKLREREQFIENNSFSSNALAEKLLRPGNIAGNESGSDLPGSDRNSPTAAIAENNRESLEKKNELNAEEASEASTLDLHNDAHTNDDDTNKDVIDNDDDNGGDGDGTSSIVTRAILTALLQKRHLTEDKNPAEIIKLERELHQIRCVVALQRIYRREMYLKSIRLKRKRERDAKLRAGLIVFFVVACAYFGVKFVGLVVSLIRNLYRRVFVMEPYDRTIVYAGTEKVHHLPWYMTAGIADLAPLTHARYSIAMNELDQLAFVKKKKMKGENDDDIDDDSSEGVIDSLELARLRAKYEKNLEIQKASFESEIEQRQCKRRKASEDPDEALTSRAATKLIEISQRELERSLSRARQRELAAVARLDRKTKQFEKEKERLLGGFVAKLIRMFWTTVVFVPCFLFAWSSRDEHHRAFSESASEVFASVQRGIVSLFASPSSLSLSTSSSQL